MRYQVLLDAQSFYDFADTEGFVSSEETDDLDPVWLREDIEGFLEEIYIIRIGEAEIIHWVELIISVYQRILIFQKKAREKIIL
jgi:hypothetical protein